MSLNPSAIEAVRLKIDAHNRTEPTHPYTDLEDVVEYIHEYLNSLVRVEIPVIRCARCGLNHDKVVFEPLVRPVGPVGYTYMGWCNNSRGPIAMRIVTTSLSELGT